MPLFEFQTPDGRKFEVEAPDTRTAISAWQSQERGHSKPQTGVVEDYAKGIGSGLVEGTEFLAGAPGDVQGAMQAAGGWLGNTAREFVHSNPQLPDWIPRPPSGALTPEQLQAVNKETRLSLPTSAEVANFHRPVTGFTPYEPERTGARYAKTAATFAPSAAAAGLPGGIRSATMAVGKYGVVPGLTSEAGGDLASAAYGEDARLYGQFAGALGGPMMAGLAKRAVTPFPSNATQADAANYLRAEGVNVTAGQATGNLKLKYRESQQGGVAAAQIAEQAGEQYTAAALRRAGVNGTRATPDTINRGFDEVGQRFDVLGARNQMRIDTQLGIDVADTMNDYRRLVDPPNMSPVVNHYFHEIANKATRSGSALPGDVYVNLRSRIMTDARNVSDAATRAALRGLAHSLDDAMDRAIAATNPSDLGAFREARRLYKNMLVLDHAAGAAGPTAAAGIISPAQLRMAVQAVEGRRARSRGYSDFDDLVRAGELAMTPLPQSGTAPRMAPYVQGLTTIAGAGAGFQAGGGTENLSGGIPGALMGALLSRAVPAAVSGGMMSGPGQRYLGNQLMSRTVADPRAAAMATLLNSSTPFRQPLVPPGTPLLPAPR